jgi:hypothetical protein
MRFLAAEADPHFEAPRRSFVSIRSADTTKSSIADAFLPRGTSVVNIEIGVFGRKDYDRARAQSAQYRQCFTITVLMFAVLAVLAWTIAVTIMIVEHRK